jgi:hypothetical protein
MATGDRAFKGDSPADTGRKGKSEVCLKADTTTSRYVASGFSRTNPVAT